MRLIDADALKKFLHEDDFDTPDERWKPESEFAKMIDALPTADIKTEVAREIFAEIEKISYLTHGFNEQTVYIKTELEGYIKLKNKYTKEGVGE